MKYKIDSWPHFEKLYPSLFGYVNCNLLYILQKQLYLSEKDANEAINKFIEDVRTYNFPINRYWIGKFEHLEKEIKALSKDIFEVREAYEYEIRGFESEDELDSFNAYTH